MPSGLTPTHYRGRITVTFFNGKRDIIGTYVFSVITRDDRLRLFVSQATQAMLFTDLAITGVKYAATRLRPDSSNDLSFPSGHTSRAFALAEAVRANFGWKAGGPAYGLAVFMGLTRIDMNRHFLSDVLVGGAVGVLMSRMVTQPLANRGVSVSPIVGADGALGLGASVDLR